MDALEIHRFLKGKIRTALPVEKVDRETLSLLYTPGVADVARACAEDPEKTYVYTSRWNTVAVVSDGSAVLGLGNIGPYGALPVMEGKAFLFKAFADIDAFPICLSESEEEKIISIVKSLEPSFGGINLEDIGAPKCFRILQRLSEEMNIPVFHDDQQGTAVVVSAAFLNALKLTEKKIEEVKVVVNGIGAAGYNIVKFLLDLGVKNVVAVDRKGILNENDPETCLNEYHLEIARITNPERLSGDLETALEGADFFIGVSRGNILKPEWIKKMSRKPVIFALANPVPEIDPELAREAGAFIVATGRSDHPNQVNNLLAFPGIMKGAVEKRSKITKNMLLSAVEAIARSCEPEPERIIPEAFDMKVHLNVYTAVKGSA
ncbi:malate dehydrogenase [Thermotoga maritima MSB8]|uniref:Malate oxidoreductase n=1 Tax=Thermotoga maritima (strain ATCC 43589 / DSM 3109 / JCM 10099 / NBRC 100826 / MSB8) TaxID=243274 RepID=Q9WZ12_THEMA|nr:NADP-dependent malic enzyme [Thermotoga maritima]AAD35627.1 malate oxidoreductase [Thermotoga maritima MSB8]AGL49464.1 NAD-dependent malic enzyme [Thermotoga maritima MSB8]AHD17702.1 malate dehydrogenase [Thermotoga maritima MSB8]AKE26464.1 malate dehydrogenase [Thermotoga maritima]AKE28329.1 malate dehydrogenase [Thermotoga maritima MSB8]